MSSKPGRRIFGSRPTRPGRPRTSARAQRPRGPTAPDAAAVAVGTCRRVPLQSPTCIATVHAHVAGLILARAGQGRYFPPAPSRIASPSRPCSPPHRRAPLDVEPTRAAALVRSRSIVVSSSSSSRRLPWGPFMKRADVVRSRPP
jgi:hypothetical protein